MPRRIDRGTPIEDLVKGSYDYLTYQIRKAFERQFGRDSWSTYLIEYFADHVIVKDFDLPADEYWRVSYTRSGDDITFANRDDWEKVELTYVPTVVVTDRRRSDVAFEERGTLQLMDAKTGQPRRVRAVVQTIGVVNANSRRYSGPVVTEAVKRAQAKMGQWGTRADQQLLGEVEHPSDKPAGLPQFLENVVVWESLSIEGKQVIAEGRLIETSKGKDAIVIMEAGVMPGISIRGRGVSTLIKESGAIVEEVLDLDYIALDMVATPADVAGAITILERAQQQARSQTNTQESTPMDLEKLRAQYPELVAQIEREHDSKRKLELEEALQRRKEHDDEINRVVAQREKELRDSLGLKETDDLQKIISEREATRRQLEDAERARQVTAYIDEQTKDVAYPDWLKAQFLEAVKAQKPATIEDAKNVIVAKRGEYDGIAARIKLTNMGHGGQAGRGPVIEGGECPAHLKPAFAMADSVARVHLRESTLHRLAAPKSVNERFAQEYLTFFDSRYRNHLVAEARLFEEAEQTTDLSLPYTVARTILAEALPELVAIGLFDVQLAMNQGPTVNVWYESYAAESGAVVAVTDEAVTGSNPVGSYVNLAKQMIQPGTVVVTNSGASVTYVEGTDYVIDYINGKLMSLVGGAITNGQSLLVDYSYDAIRKGEMAAIERGKMTLAYAPLVMAADRLATQITNEAVLFSRGSLGFDAIGRTLLRLVEQLNRKIDGGLMYLALTSALKVASNSGGTWTASGNDYDAFNRLIGVSKVKVANRNYNPTAILMSATNADRISNWTGFTQAGTRPDADLNAKGYLGRLKNLPVFYSTVFTDAYALVLNREVVHHRIASPMMLKGPFPSYDQASAKLIGAEQWYAEEMNGSMESPQLGKASSVKIA